MRHYGFNLTAMTGKMAAPQPLDNAELDFVAEHGFNYIRLPLNYHNWIRDFEYEKPDERMLEVLDGHVAQCLERGLHVGLNLHRAPGYCINKPELERDSLWTDLAAQDGFVLNWEMFARRYKHIPSEKMSFNLVNEPCLVGKKDFTRENHAAIMRRAIAAIRAISPEREIVLDGVDGGHSAIPELADTGAVHSVRGYQPFHVTHHGASWCGLENSPAPSYPLEANGEVWDRARLLRFYEPWRDVERAGVKVMMGEFGCYNKTPNDVAMRWFEDLLGIYREFKWGYVLWNLRGAFGVIAHGRPGTTYTRMNGFDVDAQLLALLKENRV